ncbi:citrulline utilization hydrolase CtlX [Paraburkholderia tropica]|uniref:citrulline utilization hydrolase CtlX n=1 Tax=Paraburkholderia tropica TaxID=92647 RepID=UPI002AB25586|nr:arginine deiminase-related protein [Paraburkholderia tropica]
MYQQTTDTVLMVRPARFAFNPETARDNLFQHDAPQRDGVHRAALAEFEAYVDALRARRINVLVVDDTLDPPTPDSIFPNNWWSSHADGSLVLYPMRAPNRREERHGPVLGALARHAQWPVTVDLSGYEREAVFLEGTGSVVFDRDTRRCYACRSPRTHQQVLDALTQWLGYETIVFDAVDARGAPIYHTNVMMWIGTALAGVCLDAITDVQARRDVLASLRAAGKHVIELSGAQLAAFAGNMLELRDGDGAPMLVMSRTAWASLDVMQRALIEAHATPVVVDIDTIEHVGGGSARCMLAEVFAPTARA